MSADLWSTLVLILVTAADAILRLWPYVAGGASCSEPDPKPGSRRPPGEAWVSWASPGTSSSTSCWA